MGEGPATFRARCRKSRRYAAVAAATVLGAGLAVGTTMTGANAAPHAIAGSAGSWFSGARNRAPIKHIVVIFQENISFDHYFGTYPHAANTGGQPFRPKPRTPHVNGLLSPAPGGGTLLTNNPNGANPRRYDPTNATTCSPATRTTTTPTSRSL